MEQTSIIEELSQPVIAPSAQDTSHFIRFVVVIDIEKLSTIVQIKRCATNSALLILTGGKLDYFVG